MTLILLLVAASRILRLDVWHMQPSPDEVWSIWQTFGSLGDVIRWTPYDWPPGYYVTLWGWQNLVGIHPIAIRMLSACAMLIGTAGMYRSARTLSGPKAGMFAALAYAAFGYIIFLSIELRGYALLLGLMPLALWQTMRYFRTPTLTQGVLTGLLLAAMLYISLTSAPAMLMIGLLTLIIWRQAVWRWWLPALTMSVLYLPELANKLPLAQGRVGALNDIDITANSAITSLYRQYFGTGEIAFAILCIVAAFFLLRALRSSRVAPVLLIWGLMPLVLFVTHRYIGFFYARYSWWVMPGLALWLGFGLARLPRVLTVIAAGILSVLLFFPLPLSDYQIRPTGLAQIFSELARNVRWGDVVLVDPNCDCLDRTELDYYSRVYFPDGLTFVSEPASYQRIWYVSNGRSTPELSDEINATRLGRQGFGPARHYFRLYEAPPDREGVRFDNGMVFHGADFPDSSDVFSAHEGETITVRLWWSAAEPVTLDYSAGLYLMDRNGALVAQVDGPPGLGQLPPTSEWIPGRLYVEERQITVPFPASTGSHPLRLGVYHFADPERVNAPGLTEDRLYRLDSVYVMSW